MALSIKDVIIRDVWTINGYDIKTGKFLFSLKHANSVEWQNTATETRITGGKNSPVLAIFSGEVASSLVVESATFDLDLLALQTGDMAVQATDILVPISEEISIGATGSEDASKATIKYTPDTSYDVTVILDDGSILLEGDTVTATTFTVATKGLTFDATHAGKTGKVSYYTSASEAVEIVIDAQSPIKYARIVAEISVQNQCDGLDYMGSLEIPRASIDKNFSIATAKAGEGAVHSVTFTAINTCGNTGLARLVVWDAAKLT